MDDRKPDPYRDLPPAWAEVYHDRDELLADLPPGSTGREVHAWADEQIRELEAERRQWSDESDDSYSAWNGDPEGYT